MPHAAIDAGAPAPMGPDSPDATDEQAVGLAVAALDAVLERAVRDHLVSDLLGDDESVLFGSGGTFSALDTKIRVGHGFGLFGPITRGDLLIIVRIRDLLAADAERRGFELEELGRLCDQLALLGGTDDATETRRPAGCNSLPPRDKFLATTELIVASIRTFLDGRSTAKLRHLQRSLRDLRVARDSRNAGRFPELVRSRAVGTGLP